MAPPDGIPPPLPPSVEDAYRQKCIQLKKRMGEVAEANATSAIRLQRLHRGIEKMRLERAFLLEQLAKRTSTKADDSEGSPSPPPTVRDECSSISTLHKGADGKLYRQARGNCQYCKGEMSKANIPRHEKTQCVMRPGGDPTSKWKLPRSNCSQCGVEISTEHMPYHQSRTCPKRPSPQDTLLSPLANPTLCRKTASLKNEDLTEEDSLTDLTAKPKEKPLRTKRGHRKPSFLQNLENGAGMTAFSTSSITQNNAGNNAMSLSPSSEAFSHAAPSNTQPQTAKDPTLPAPTANGTALSSISERPRSPKNAFELFANEQRPVLTTKHKQDIKDGTFDLDQELARRWRGLPEDQRDEFENRYQKKDFRNATQNDAEEDADDDVEMADDVEGDNDS